MAGLSEKKRIISLITDFGQKDPFVGIMKGVMLNINPDLVFVDISHEIAPHDTLEAALTLKLAYGYFPKETIHVVIVDPGVGGERLPLAASKAEYFFVGPDNGVLSLALEDANGEKKVIELSERTYFNREISSTFHGRDLFAPVAAWLSKGVTLTQLGPAVSDYQKITLPRALLSSDRVFQGEIIYYDHFGNLMTNICRSDIEQWGKELGQRIDLAELRVRIGPYDVSGVKKSYDQGSSQRLSALFNSFDYLEIFLFQESAQRFTQFGPKEKVFVSC
ncbi:MAG: SAM-dependent chlorinase/fluorinase [Candidatus Tectomicrobia bacterium]|uniref:SAM-dependent chlorinase/fluorinase n=1 Tax=Tectimicrobiota bacterium TaxID=2528274 RepID=A0A933LQ47_UNCTE|nr:SAM-dependent chlorinase/fluorinase [Candidatus Tectomicrobia bacterium]